MHIYYINRKMKLKDISTNLVVFLRYLTVNNSVDKTQLDYNEIAKYRNT